MIDSLIYNLDNPEAKKKNKILSRGEMKTMRSKFALIQYAAVTYHGPDTTFVANSQVPKSKKTAQGKESDDIIGKVIFSVSSHLLMRRWQQKQLLLPPNTVQELRRARTPSTRRKALRTLVMS